MPDTTAAESSTPVAPTGTPQVGDVLIVTGGYGRNEPREGRVAALRRKYMTVEVERGSGRVEPIDFDIATSIERSNPNENGHYLRRARTLEQVNHDQRLNDAWLVLKNNGLAFSLGHRRISDEQVFAIADLLSSDAEADV